CSSDLDCDLFIGAAAVADYRPVTVAPNKIKKTGDDRMTIELMKNPDIIAAVAALQPRPFTAGFAAESEHLLDYARRKLQQKNLDLIIANNIAAQGIGLDSDENEVSFKDQHSQKYMDPLSQRK